MGQHKLFRNLGLGLLALVGTSSIAFSQKQMETLSRGVVATVRNDGNVFISWRLLATEPLDTAFNLYRQSGSEKIKLNKEPLTKGTCFTDTAPNLSNETTYTVTAIVDGKEVKGKPYTLPAGSKSKPYLSIPLQKIEGYAPNDCSIADLDGDGEYDIVVHMAGRARDNSQGGVTDPPILQGYKFDGTLLWSINLGKNIRDGAHYTQFMVYDFDGDGRAEMMCKTADGTVDGTGKIIGDKDANYVNDRGYILAGPEFITVFDGKTGEALATDKYAPGRYPDKTDPTSDELKAFWGDGYGNRGDRFLASVAYLDGERPSAIFSRGYYTRSFIAAWDWRDGKLTRRWLFDSEDPTTGVLDATATVDNKYKKVYSGQGFHSMSVADVDGDGKDEIIFGSMTINSDGTPRYSTGWGHGDALHVGDLDPSNPGLEVFGIQERFSDAGAHMHAASTGKELWKKPSVSAATSGGDKNEGPGRGVSFNIDPRHPGNESWTAGAGIQGMWNAKGEKISDTKPGSVNFRIFWDGDLLDELLDKNRVSKWNWETGKTEALFTAEGCTSNNGTKSTPAISADLFGDWREEVVLRTEDNSELRIFTTTIPTEHRIYSLMQDPQYRVAIAWQNTAYNQPPHTSFYIGEDMKTPPTPNIKLVPPANAK